MSAACLQTLPVELIHQILDNLDTETIFLSLRTICKRFYTIINIYNRYKLDFRYFSKVNFHQVCRIVHLENIISIILSDEDETPGQTGLFLSLIDLHKLTRLQSLTLYLIEESSLKTFLNHTHIFLLVSLSIKWRKHSNLTIISTNLLSSVIAKLTNLQRLHLELENYSIENIPWSQENSIKYLFLNRCTLKQAIFALCYLPRLHTLVLNDVNVRFNKNVFIAPSELTSSLKSLTIEQKYIPMNKLESILLLTPSLIHLKITGWTRLVDNLYDGFQWEKFIKRSLTHLEKFEFFFHLIVEKHTISDLESIIAPFHTWFWLENKHWYVTCEYIKDLDLLKLYSMPICESILSYDCEFNKISCSTMPITNINPASMMDNVSNLQIELTPKITDAIAKKNEQGIQRLFNNITELSLSAKNDWPQGSIEYLSSIIDLSHVRKISLDITFDQNFLHQISLFFNNLLKQAYNIRKINILFPLFGDITEKNTETICSILSNQVKHLIVYVHNLIVMKMILERNENLFSVTFNSSQDLSNDYDEIILWLKQKKIQFIHLKYDFSLSIWFDH